MAAALPGEAERLYALPPERFVEERDALARRLREEGRRDEAAEVKRLRRPSVAASVVNRVARERRGELRRLLAAADRLRAGSDEAADEFRKGVAALVEEARRLLEEEGRPATDATLAAVGDTLRAGAADEGAEREALERGALERELEPRGFEAMAAFAEARPPRRERNRRTRDEAELASRRRRADEARAALAAARADEREARRGAVEAERAAERARRELERARERLGRAEERLRAVESDRQR